MVTVEQISDPAQLPAIAQEWDELIDERSPGAVFRSSDWLVPWWRYFSRGKELSIYAAREGTRLLGVLPAYRDRSPLGGRRLRLVGDWPGTAHYLGVIALPNKLDAAVQHIAQAVLADEREVLLDGVLADDPLIDALREPGRAVWATATACPYVEIDGQRDFDAWIRGRPRGLAAQLRRRRRWLESRAHFRIETVTDEEELAAALPTFWQLHRARWSADGLSRAQRIPQFEQFHIDIARALARRGWARLYLLHAEGAPRAALYGFERGRRFHYYQSGSDPEWRQRSVGTVVLCAALQDAFERGLIEFDLLRGDDSYKSLYASSRRQILTLRTAAGPRVPAVWVGDQGRQLLLRAAGTVPRSVRRHLRTWAAGLGS